MNLPRPAKAAVQTLLSVALVLAVAAGPAYAGQKASRSTVAAPTGSRYITTFQVFHTSFVRNFNPFSPDALDFTAGAIYEPLYIITTAGGGRSYPWLATAYQWRDGGKTLLITLRHGVRWSDGQPLTARDVL